MRWLRGPSAGLSLLLLGVSTPITAQTIEGDPANARRGAAETAIEQPTDASSASPAAAITGVLPKVRLTPRDITVAGLDEPRIDLGGTWNFVFEVPGNFDGGAGSIADWAEVEMPGHFALQGHPRMHKEFGRRVAYAKTFEIPDSWKDTRIVLRFEGVDGYTKLWVNGEKAGENDIATLPSEFDITDFVDAGEQNELTLTIEKSLVTHWSRRELGGITRPVFLQALPTVNLARLHVDTDLADDGRSALMRAHVRVANQHDTAASGLAMKFTLLDADGQEHALRDNERIVPLPAVAAGQMLEFVVPLHVAAPEAWTAETPKLYQLVGELLKEDSSVMTARQRFGFREVAVVGHELRINGRPVKLRGTNFHITYPGYNESVPNHLLKRDIELFRGANLNALRSRPTPMIEYVEYCDELGVYTTIEAMISLMMYDKGPNGDHGADPAIAGPYRHHLATMIESYYSHPSVITWGLGNECEYFDYFKTAALGAHAADTTRPLFFGSDARLGVDIAYMDINDDHYPRKHHSEEPPYHVTAYTDDPTRIDGGGWDYPDDRPNIFTEWLHMHTNNTKEIAYDPGVDDYWGYVAATHAEALYRIPHFAGGFHFKGAPYRGIVASPIWRGLFDEDRRPNDTYWHVQKSHSPVRIADTTGVYDAGQKAARFGIENRYDFRNLSDMTFRWSRRGQRGEVTAEVPARQSGVIVLPLDNPGTDESIQLEVLDPKGQLVDRYQLTVDPPRQGVPDGEVDDAPPALVVHEDEEQVEIETAGGRFAIDQSTGLLVSAFLADQPVVNGPPRLLVLPSQLRNFRRQKELTLVNQCFDWSADDVRIETDDRQVVATARGRYVNAQGSFVTTITADGVVKVAYDFVWTGDQDFNLFSSGLAIPVDEALDSLRWARKAQWSSYPADHIGRPAGVAAARGDASYADLRDAEHDGPRPWPWSQDLIAGVTRDFRSTKFNLIDGGLYSESGAGISVVPQGRQHLQAIPANDSLDGDLHTEELHGPASPGWHLHVLDFHNGGTEPHLTKSLRFETRIVRPEERFLGNVVFRLNDSPE